MDLSHKDLLGIEHLTVQEITLILDTAVSMKEGVRARDKESSNPARKNNYQSFLRTQHAHAHLI